MSVRLDRGSHVGKRGGALAGCWQGRRPVGPRRDREGWQAAGSVVVCGSCLKCDHLFIQYLVDHLKRDTLPRTRIFIHFWTKILAGLALALSQSRWASRSRSSLLRRVRSPNEPKTEPTRSPTPAVARPSCQSASATGPSRAKAMRAAEVPAAAPASASPIRWFRDRSGLRSVRYAMPGGVHDLYSRPLAHHAVVPAVAAHVASAAFASCLNWF